MICPQNQWCSAEFHRIALDAVVEEMLRQREAGFNNLSAETVTVAFLTQWLNLAVPAGNG